MKTLIFLLIAAIAAGCAGTPPADTLEKRLYAVEVTWQNTLELVQKNAARLSTEQRQQVRERLTDGQRAIEAARLAVTLGDQAEFENRAAVVNSAINIMRQLLETLEQSQTSRLNNGKHIERAYFAGPDTSRRHHFRGSLGEVSPG